MASSETTPIKAAQAALLDFAQDPNDPRRFQACAELLTPSLFKGKGQFFDHLCSHARDSAPAELAPAIVAFMDQLCSQGGFDAPSGRVWRSAALLCELHPEEELDDPSFLTALDSTRQALAKFFGASEDDVALSPIALDLRHASLGFSQFQWAMLPTQLGGIDLAALQADNPNQALPQGSHEPARLWKALMFSCAFDADPGPFEDRLRDALGDGAAFPCAYRFDGQERSAVLVAKEVRGPFSCLAFGFEPERWELEADLARLEQAFEGEMSRLSAFLEPILLEGSGARLPAAQQPLDSFGLSICAPDGELLDALWLPARPESVALAQRMLEQAKLPLRMSEPAKMQRDEQGRRLWRASLGRSAFDVEVWRKRVLGA